MARPVGANPEQALGHLLVVLLLGTGGGLVKLLDLMCGAGGAAVGYANAGFEVTGVDNVPQPRYPFKFIQADAYHYLSEHWAEYDAIHASPPCQRYSTMSTCRPGLRADYPDLVGSLRGLLELTSKPYVLENVPGSPLRADLVLCGQMFDLPLYRHRIFESNLALMVPAHPEHVLPGSKAGHWKPGQIISVSGHCAPMALARQAMGIDWMTRAELAESVPPRYTQFVGTVIKFRLRAHDPASSRPAEESSRVNTTTLVGMRS